MVQVSDIDISIVIPVYHVPEELLLRCLQSIKSIRGLSREVLLVADGEDQTVCSGPAVRKFAEEADFPVFFHVKKHEGVSAARNYGISHSCGTWIFFMDADDYICGDAFEKIAPRLKDEEIDMVIMDYSMMTGNECSRHYYKKEMDFINLDSFQRDILKPQSGAGFVWSKLYRREWLSRSGVCFDTELSAAEDAEFVLKLALKKPKVFNVPYNSYYYCYNPQSAVHSFRQDYADRYINGMQKIRDDLKRENAMTQLQDEYDSCVLYHLLLIAVNFSFHPENPSKGKKRIHNFQKITRQKIFKEALKNIHLENFSMTRKVTLVCIRLHLYRVVEMIAKIRHRQRET